MRACACTDTSCPAGQDCVNGACLRSNVLPLAAPARWTQSPIYGGVQTSFADVDNDGRADAIAVDTAGMTVYRASPNGTFVPNTWTPTGPFLGTKSPFSDSTNTSFADVNGDGCADAIAVGDIAIIVRRSNCRDAFGPSETWGTKHPTTWKTVFADMDGDGCADAVEVDESGTLVRRALPCPASATTAARFSTTYEKWSEQFVGTDGTVFVDVTGDGKADGIVLNRGYGFTVRRSNGALLLPNELWAYDAFKGASAILFGDVTGDGMADVVAVDGDGAWMLRSNRWFFGGIEQLSAFRFSPSPRIPGPSAFALADVTGDGRADLVQVNDDAVWVSTREDRRIPIRFVQLVVGAGAALPESDLQAAVSLANEVFRSAGVQFYVRASEVVVSAALHDLTKSTPASSPELAAATNMFNPGCESGADLATLSPVQQMKTVATRCSLDGEILVYVARVDSSTALLPWEGRAFFMDPADLAAGSGANVRLAHEIGHYLGLPHVFGCCSDNDLSHADLVVGNIKDPDTGGVAPLSMFWDLVYAAEGSSNYTFDDAPSASNFETSLKPIQATGAPTDLTAGWYCPSGDATRACNSDTPPGGICLQVSDSQTGTQDYCSGDRVLQGLGLRLHDDVPTINVMSFGYAPPMPALSDLARRPPSLSLSQIEQIQRSLRSEMVTPIRSAAGQTISGGRPGLGR
jgi:hypothetical protein